MESTQENQKQSAEDQKIIPVTKDQIDALRKCLKEKIDDFRNKGKKNKRGAATVQIIIIIFSVSTPILIGWKVGAGMEDVTRNLTNFALICSAITAGSSMLYNFFDYKDLWVQYKISINELNSISSELDYFESAGTQNITKTQIDFLFAKYIEICADTNRSYRKIRLTKDVPDDKKR